jgi:hypothetical protein
MLFAIRRAGSDLNMRAMRRGSLQTLAQAGHTAEQLLAFSGHASVEMLKRYLDWGRLFGHEQQAGQAAAAALYPQRL